MRPSAPVFIALFPPGLARCGLPATGQSETRRSILAKFSKRFERWLDAKCSVCVATTESKKSLGFETQSAACRADAASALEE